MTERHRPNSPVCFAHEAPAYMGYATRAEISGLLSALLEMERALAGKLREILPKISDDDLRDKLVQMLATHERHIERLESQLANPNG